MQVQPYLSFDGRCDEAIEFYRKAIGAEVLRKMRFNESPDPTPPGMLAPGWENKVMHASLQIGESTVMASDGCGGGHAEFKGISLSLAVDSDADAERRFKALSDGGKVTMPLGKTFFASSFGMVTDRFGVSWMVIAGK